MFFAELLLAFVLALAFALAFEALFKRPGPWGATWAFVLVTFLVVLAVGAWVQPFGPTLFGIHWAPFVATGLLLMALFAAIPAQPIVGGVRTDDAVPRSEAAAASIALGFAFWVFVVVLLVASGIAYYTDVAAFMA